MALPSENAPEQLCLAGGCRAFKNSFYFFQQNFNDKKQNANKIDLTSIFCFH